MNRSNLLSKSFLLVILGQIISIFGNQILRYALPLYLLNQTGSAGLFGTISAIAFIPMLVLFPIGGIIADRFNKKYIMVILDFSTALLITVFCILRGRIDIVPLMASTLITLFGIQGVYQPAVKASIPILVQKQNLMRANAIVDVINSLASTAGPVIGGIAFSIFGIMPILYISIGCFILSAIIEIFIYLPREEVKLSGNIILIGWNDMNDSFSFIFKKQSILGKMAFIYAALNLFLITLILIAVPVLITQQLGFNLEKANRLYGYAQGVIAMGAVLGGISASALSKRLRPKSSSYILMSCAITVGITGLLIQLTENPNWIFIVLALGSSILIALSTIFQIQVMSYVQMVTPAALIGKVISCFICISMCTNPLGQLIYGMVFDQIKGKVCMPFYIAAFIVLGISLKTSRLFDAFENVI